MTISYPLSLPAAAEFTDFVLRPHSVVAVSKSPFTGEEQIQARPGQWWEGEARLPRLRDDTARLWEAFFVSLNGREGTFKIGDPLRTSAPAAAIATPPVVDGGSQTGNVLDIKDAPTSESGYLLAGNLIQIGTPSIPRLHMVLQTVDTDESGLASVPLWPTIRESPADESNVIVENPVGLFRATSNANPFSRQAPYFTNLSFSFREAL